MTQRLTNLRVTRISLVKKPANRRKFVLLKGDDDQLEVIKAVHHHIDGILDAIGYDDEERKEKVEALIDLFDNDAATDALMRFLNFLRTASEVQGLLGTLMKADEDENLSKYDVVGDDDDVGEPEDFDPDSDDMDERIKYWNALKRRMYDKLPWLRGADTGNGLMQKGVTTDMAETVTVDFGGGVMLQGVDPTARARDVLVTALEKMAGVDALPEDQRTPDSYTKPLLKMAGRSPEFKRLYQAYEFLTGEESLAPGYQPTIAEFAQEYQRRGHRRWS